MADAGEDVHPYVVIVSNNPETLDGLQSYLHGAGIPSRSTRSIHDPANVAPPHATVAVIFPDDFAEKDVVELVRALRCHRPRLLALLVTREPGRYRAVVARDGKSLPPLLLPRPSFGWDIIDRIRAHATPNDPT